MKIAIIGTGNVGGALATRFAEVGHVILLGVRDTSAEKVQLLLQQNPAFQAKTIHEATTEAEVIILAIPPVAIQDVAAQMLDVDGKVIIDATNSVFKQPLPYAHVCDALRQLKPNALPVKCFNTTGYENMLNPVYEGTPLDMYVAGEAPSAKAVATALAKEIGFGEVYDFGGFDKITLIEHYAMAWINLAIMQGEGRNIGFKILKR